MDNEFLVAEHIYKDWGSVSVDFSFAAGKASFTSIVGPSGSGKSTVLRTIAGLIPAAPQTRIVLDGADITQLAPGRRECGLVLQNNSLFLHMTVADNVGYGLRCQGASRKEARKAASDFLARFGLGGFDARYPETLSGGEAQRVALARTLIVRPKLVLFDEPFSALDAPLRKRLAGDILRMQEEFAFTAVMVTHDIAEAKYMSSRIILMQRGKKIWDGLAGEFDEQLIQDAGSTKS